MPLWKLWLSASERRLIGVWTWQDGPGELTIHFRDDGTMLYLGRPTLEKDRITFTRWHIDGEELSIEYAPRRILDYVVQKGGDAIRIWSCSKCRGVDSFMRPPSAIALLGAACVRYFVPPATIGA